MLIILNNTFHSETFFFFPRRGEITGAHFGMKNTCTFVPIDSHTIDAIGKACYAPLRRTEERRKDSLSGFVNLPDCEKCRRSQVSWDPDSVLCGNSQWDTSGGTSLSPLRGGGPKAHVPTCSRTRTVQGVHTRSPLQEIRMTSGEESARSFSEEKKRRNHHLRNSMTRFILKKIAVSPHPPAMESSRNQRCVYKSPLEHGATHGARRAHLRDITFY